MLSTWKKYNTQEKSIFHSDRFRPGIAKNIARSSSRTMRERDKIKAIIYFALTALLATVAGLVTHFDALAHASGLSITDKGVSGI